MGSRSIPDPDWEPYRQVVKLRLAASELNELNRLCFEHGLSRALLLRRAIEYGLPPGEDSLDVPRLAGMLVRIGRPPRVLQTIGYGPRTLRPITPVFGAESLDQRLNRRSLSVSGTGGVLLFCSAPGWAPAGYRPGQGRRPAGPCLPCRWLFALVFRLSWFTCNPRSRLGAVPTRCQVAICGVRAQRAQPALF